MAKTRFHPDALTRFTRQVFCSCGVSADDAEIAAEVLLYADCSGIRTHGVYNLERIYVSGLKEGRINPRPKVEIATQTVATVVLDANQGLGLAVGKQAMDLAISKAAICGVGIAVVRNSTHFGAAGYYVSQAIEQGMVGIASTNLGNQPVAPPPGGALKMLGSNPLSIGAPARHRPPILLDMSTTAVSTSRIRQAAKNGQSIPEGWLVDSSGSPVVDPDEFLAGTAHPEMLGGRPTTGGFKGYGLNIALEVLCGILPSAGIAPTIKTKSGMLLDEGQNIGHFFQAIDVRAFQPLTSFTRRADEVADALLSCPAMTPGQQVQYAGFPEFCARRESDRRGVLIDESTLASLDRIADDLEIPKLTAGTGMQRLTQTKEIQNA